MVTFPGFHLYIELKENEPRPRRGKVAYIKQAVTYRSGRHSHRIPRRAPFEGAQGDFAPPQPARLVTHAAFEVTAGAPESHIVMLEVPGDRTAPSQMKK